MVQALWFGGKSLTRVSLDQVVAAGVLGSLNYECPGLEGAPGLWGLGFRVKKEP